MTKVNSVLVLPLSREGISSQPPPGVKERVYEAVIEEKTKDYIFLRICKDCCDELGLLPDREIQVWVAPKDKEPILCLSMRHLCPDVTSRYLLRLVDEEIAGKYCFR